MKPQQRDDSLLPEGAVWADDGTDPLADAELPEGAVWADDGTDPLADAEWLASFQYTDRHFRLYDVYDRRILPGQPENRILFGVVLIDGDDIETSLTGILSPSPSMIGHLDVLFPREQPRNLESPHLETYSEFGLSRDAYRFGSDVGFRLHKTQINQNKMRWQSVRSLPPPPAFARCAECNGILATLLAKQCLHCGADWH